jgi:hypothetical protein
MIFDGTSHTADGAQSIRLPKRTRLLAVIILLLLSAHLLVP